MKLTQELIAKTISSVAGEDVLPVVESLKGRENVSEFILAQEVEHEINAVRNMLYRLYHANLVTFTRKKDKQKGWYIYYWTLNPKMISTHIENLETRKLEGLRNRLDRETGKEFYACPERCMRLEFVKAMDFEFKCPECGNIMQHQDNSETIEKIKQDLVEVENKKARLVASSMLLKNKICKMYALTEFNPLRPQKKEKQVVEKKKVVNNKVAKVAKKVIKKVVKKKPVVKKTVKKATKKKTVKKVAKVLKKAIKKVVKKATKKKTTKRK